MKEAQQQTDAQTRLNAVNDAMAQLIGAKKQNRTDAIKRTSSAFYSYLKFNRYAFFSRDLIARFIPATIGVNTRCKLTREILRDLITEKRAEKSSRYKTYARFKLCELSTNDYDSFSVMMNKNGYRTHFFKWEKDATADPQTLPTRKRAGIGNINGNNADLLENCDDAEQISTKPRAKQGVYDAGNLSIRKTAEQKRILCYAVL